MTSVKNRVEIAACLLAAFVVIAWPQPLTGVWDPQADRPQAALDLILDTYVRDGLVYYRALRSDRSKLDGYATSIGTAQVDRLKRDEQLAFWLNAYNALVLRTVIDHYPIQGTSKSYPAHSIRQIPGAFERLPHKVAGRMLTLDQIEQTVLPPFHDPRVYLALGRGAVGSGRLRSEVYAAETLEAQLANQASECVSHATCVQVDRGANKLIASSVFSWREMEFTGAYADTAPAVFASRSPIERALIAFVEPKLLTTERELLAKNAFQMSYLPFDWSLNDLTGRGGR